MQSEIQEIIGQLESEVSNGIAVKSVLQRFAHDDRIPEAYNDTYEANAFNVVESSLMYTLTMTLMRICDETQRRDINSLQTLFDKVPDNECSTRYFSNHADRFEKARDLYKSIKGSHQLARVKSFRHGFIAHSAFDTAKVNSPKYDHLYELLSLLQKTVEYLVLAARDQSLDYDGESIIWDKYSASFFDNMILGQLNVKMP